MNIAVIGTGYVGLVTGTCLAETGNDVICVDIDREKIKALQNGRVPFYEPGLEEMVDRNVREQRLSFSDHLAPAVRKSKIIFIAVGTPQRPDGTANIDQVKATAEQIARSMNGRKIVVTKSTVPVGTAVKVEQIIRSITHHPAAVISNPEFLKEGAAIEDFMKPDRVVLGGDDAQALELMKELYEPFVRTGNPIIVTDTRSAEMSKYAANAMLATKISFINEVAGLCEQLDADVGDVRRIIGLDRRIGPHFIFPGLGYGGSCFPKDIRALIAMGDERCRMPLLRAVDRVNERQKGILVDKVLRHFGPDLSRLEFAIWGLAFKPRTDDMREAPSIKIVNALLRAGASVRAYDPEALPQAARVFGNRIQYEENNYAVLAAADGLLILTEWNEFRRPNFQKMKALLKKPVIFDGRNIYEHAEMKRLGFTYYSIGRRDG